MEPIWWVWDRSHVDRMLHFLLDFADKIYWKGQMVVNHAFKPSIQHFEGRDRRVSVSSRPAWSILRVSDSQGYTAKWRNHISERKTKQNKHTHTKQNNNKMLGKFSWLVWAICHTFISYFICILFFSFWVRFCVSSLFSKVLSKPSFSLKKNLQMSFLGVSHIIRRWPILWNIPISRGVPDCPSSFNS